MITTVRLWQPGTWAITGAPGSPVGGSAWRLFVLGAPWRRSWPRGAFGRFRRVRAAYVEALEERARRAEQDRIERAEQAAAAERARIAGEVHDVVSHSLAVIVRQAEGGRYVAAARPEVAAETLGTVATTGREALADMRRLLGVLRDGAALDEAGPQLTLADLPALLDRVRGSGLPVELTSTGAPAPLERSTELAAYRVVQEALTNVVRHAGSGATAPPGTGQGLVRMQERATVAGGWFHAGPHPNGGFRVSVRLPARSPQSGVTP